MTKRDAIGQATTEITMERRDADWYVNVHEPGERYPRRSGPFTRDRAARILQAKRAMRAVEILGGTWLQQLDASGVAGSVAERVDAAI